MKCVLYDRDGFLSVVSPAAGTDPHDVALRCVPEGVPYLIVPVSELPTDPAYREAWAADFSEPDGVGVGVENYFLAKLRNKQ